MTKMLRHQAVKIEAKKAESFINELVYFYLPEDTRLTGGKLLEIIQLDEPDLWGISQYYKVEYTENKKTIQMQSSYIFKPHRRVKQIGAKRGKRRKKTKVPCLNGTSLNE